MKATSSSQLACFQWKETGVYATYRPSGPTEQAIHHAIGSVESLLGSQGRPIREQQTVCFLLDENPVTSTGWSLECRYKRLAVIDKVRVVRGKLKDVLLDNVRTPRATAGVVERQDHLEISLAIGHAKCRVQSSPCRGVVGSDVEGEAINVRCPRQVNVFLPFAFVPGFGIFHLHPTQLAWYIVRGLMHSP